MCFALACLCRSSSSLVSILEPDEVPGCDGAGLKTEFAGRACLRLSSSSTWPATLRRLDGLSFSIASLVLPNIATSQEFCQIIGGRLAPQGSGCLWCSVIGDIRTDR